MKRSAQWLYPSPSKPQKFPREKIAISAVSKISFSASTPRLGFWRDDVISCERIGSSHKENRSQQQRQLSSPKNRLLNLLNERPVDWDAVLQLRSEFLRGTMAVSKGVSSSSSPSSSSSTSPFAQRHVIIFGDRNSDGYERFLCRESALDLVEHSLHLACDINNLGTAASHWLHVLELIHWLQSLLVWNHEATELCYEMKCLSHDGMDWTPLHRACGAGSDHRSCWAKASSLSIGIEDTTRTSVLSKDVVSLLLDMSGITMACVQGGIYGETPLHLLLRRGTDRCVDNREGRSLLRDDEHSNGVQFDDGVLAGTTTRQNRATSNLSFLMAHYSSSYSPMMDYPYRSLGCNGSPVTMDILKNMLRACTNVKCVPYFQCYRVGKQSLPSNKEQFRQNPLSMQDVFGNTPLHLACMFTLHRSRQDHVFSANTRISSGKHTRSEFQFKMQLFRACPEAAALPNDFGLNALHCAARYMCRSRSLRQEGDVQAGEEQLSGSVMQFLSALLLPNSSSVLPLLVATDWALGYTPLHYICEHDVNPALVRHFVRYDDSAKVRVNNAATMVQDVRGFTPLHLASLDRAPAPVVRCLLRKGPEAARLRDGKGYTPLRRAWYSHVQSVEFLCKELLRPTNEPSEHGRGTMVGVTKELWDKLMLYVQAEYYGLLLSEENPEALEKDEFSRSTSVLISRVVKSGSSLVSTVSQVEEDPDILVSQRDSKESFMMVHALAGVDCPIPMLQIALKLQPDKVFEFDEKGNLPLHIACVRKVEFDCLPNRACGNVINSFGCLSPIDTDESSSVSSFDEVSGVDTDLAFDEEDDEDIERIPSRRRMSTQQKQPNSTLDVLIDVYPEAVRVPCRRTGRQPLHLAILGQKTYANGLQRIVTLGPQGLGMRDPITGLFPFMLAATVGDTVEHAAERADHFSHVYSVAERVAARLTAELQDIEACMDKYIHGGIGDAMHLPWRNHQTESILRCELLTPDRGDRVGVNSFAQRNLAQAELVRDKRRSSFLATQQAQSAQKKVWYWKIRQRRELALLDNVYRLLAAKPDLISCGVMQT